MGQAVSWGKQGEIAKITPLSFLELKKFYSKKCPYFYDSDNFCHRNGQFLTFYYLLTSIKIRSVGWVDETDEDTNLTISITFWHLIGTFNWFWLGVHKKCQFLTGCWQKSENWQVKKWNITAGPLFERLFSRKLFFRGQFEPRNGLTFCPTWPHQKGKSRKFQFLLTALKSELRT